jgi:hypothetical protein
MGECFNGAQGSCCLVILSAYLIPLDVIVLDAVIFSFHPSFSLSHRYQHIYNGSFKPHSKAALAICPH